jgi:carboxylate-amine ligase
VFGQHVHIGCKSADDALYLTHALARYVPQLIAISASSPFYQSVDTGYHSSRLTIFNSFPSSGVIPYFTEWKEFSDYFFKMRDLKIIGSMKDLYWDIRPKPEFGTVEVRVCDTPLTIKKAVLVGAYIQALALYLLEEKPVQLSRDLYYLYSFNRFQATRYGFEGDFIDPNTNQRYSIFEDILNTIKKIERYANQLNSMPYISQLMIDLVNKKNDATLLRQMYKEVSSFTKLVDHQCTIWSSDS